MAPLWRRRAEPSGPCAMLHRRAVACYRIRPCRHPRHAQQDAVQDLRSLMFSPAREHPKNAACTLRWYAQPCTPARSTTCSSDSQPRSPSRTTTLTKACALLVSACRRPGSRRDVGAPQLHERVLAYASAASASANVSSCRHVCCSASPGMRLCWQRGDCGASSLLALATGSKRSVTCTPPTQLVARY